MRANRAVAAVGAVTHLDGATLQAHLQSMHVCTCAT